MKRVFIVVLFLVALGLGLFFWFMPKKESNQAWGAVRPIEEQSKRKKQEAKLREMLPVIPGEKGIPKTKQNASQKVAETNSTAEHDGLLGCKVCGYLAVKESAAICQNCGIETADSVWELEGLTKTAFLQREQLDYFSQDTVDFKVDIMGPKVSKKGFLKDSLWKPQRFITSGRVQEFIRIKMQALKK